MGRSPPLARADGGDQADDAATPESGEDSKTALRRFQIEAQVAAELSRKSRHIVRVSDHGEDDGVAYLVMELLDGETLDQAIDAHGAALRGLRHGDHASSRQGNLGGALRRE